MFDVDINYLAVLVAGVSAVVIGSIWYAKPVFGKMWMKAMNRTEAEWEENKKGMGPIFAVMVLAALVEAYVLAHVIDYVEADTLMAGLTAGFWMWLGFAATVGATIYAFAKRGIKLFVIDYGYQLVLLLVMGAILALWQ